MRTRLPFRSQFRPRASIMMRSLCSRIAVLSSLFIANDIAMAQTSICESDNCETNSDTGAKTCTFTTKVDLYAGELGYYTFDECTGTNPTIGMEVGVTYKFLQYDRSNYMHPLGFAYLPDGAHDDVDELEPTIDPPSATAKQAPCSASAGCPAPMYFQNGEYLGTYSNNAALVNVTSGEDNFGLDDYEPKFLQPITQWVEHGEFMVALKFDDDDFDEDIFYFCHVHQYMTGRIKIISSSSGDVKNPLNIPPIPYAYDVVSEFDQSCGTFNLTDYQLPHAECPDKFVCDVPEDNTALKSFSSCIEAMDCAMVVGMTNYVSAQSEVALFIHQMIPHHQNAVNMAKALLKTGTLTCDDLLQESDDCAMEAILRDIVNGQNMQIQAMRGVLESMNYPAEDDCKVTVLAIDEDETNGSTGKSTMVNNKLVLVATLMVTTLATL
uniref:DUF305 domain-containing protein n=1 Tax=Leptocylindrus danicus TaxID=163516 RepID=A0A7S2LG87_9STRA|mmetsp:Transcript_5011/g.7356  ORF Transcript_5011/g.7356 Transcript_5011/m.7356 type:complete len:438 (+) Transcript_5011:124-1437(+)